MLPSILGSQLTNKQCRTTLQLHCVCSQMKTNTIGAGLVFMNLHFEMKLRTPWTMEDCSSVVTIWPSWIAQGGPVLNCPGVSLWLAFRNISMRNELPLKVKLITAWTICFEFTANQLAQLYLVKQQFLRHQTLRYWDIEILRYWDIEIWANLRV